MKQLRETGFNHVMPNVLSRGTTFHHSAYSPVEPALLKAGVGIHPICTLVEEGHGLVIQVIPWFEYGVMEPVTSKVVQQNPDWAKPVPTVSAG